MVDKGGCSQRLFQVIQTPAFIDFIEIRGFALGPLPNFKVALRFEKAQDIVALLHRFFQIRSGAFADGKLVIVLNQPMQPLQCPKQDKQRHEELILVKRYSPELYPRFDNYDAINVNITADIPCDYAGMMGVPITFLDKYCPEQFEIIGPESAPSNPETLNLGKDYSEYIGYSQDRVPNGRTGSTFGKCPVIEMDDKKHPYYEKDGRRVQTTYHRIFVRNKHPETPKEVQV